MTATASKKTATKSGDSVLVGLPSSGSLSAAQKAKKVDEAAELKREMEALGVRYSAIMKLLDAQTSLGEKIETEEATYHKIATRTAVPDDSPKLEAALKKRDMLDICTKTSYITAKVKAAAEAFKDVAKALKYKGGQQVKVTLKRKKGGK